MKLRLSVIVTLFLLLSSCVSVKHITPMGNENDQPAVTEKNADPKLTTGNKISQYSHDHNITEVEAQGIGADRDAAIRDAQRNEKSTAIGT